jgi:hypothetical protein
VACAAQASRVVESFLNSQFYTDLCTDVLMIIIKPCCKSVFLYIIYVKGHWSKNSTIQVEHCSTGKFFKCKKYESSTAQFLTARCH